MKTVFFRFLMLMALSSLVLPIKAEDADSIHRRMDSRLSAIDSLKSRKIVGETNTGMLQLRGQGTAQDEQLVSEENKDRSAVYAIIASQAHTSPDAVGRARAKQIAQNSRSGVWLQDDGGSWYIKK